MTTASLKYAKYSVPYSECADLTLENVDNLLHTGLRKVKEGVTEASCTVDIETNRYLLFSIAGLFENSFRSC